MSQVAEVEKLVTLTPFIITCLSANTLSITQNTAQCVNVPNFTEGSQEHSIANIWEDNVAIGISK